MSELKPQPANDVLKPQPAKEGLKAQPAKEGVKPPPAEESKEELMPPQLPEELLPENVKNFLDDGGKILFVKGLSEYQNQESLSNFFNLIPPVPEKVTFFPKKQKGDPLGQPFAFVHYKSAEDALKVQQQLS